MLNFNAFSDRDLATTLAVLAQDRQMSVEELVHAVQEEISRRGRLAGVEPAQPLRTGSGQAEKRCPSCGRFVLLRPKGVAEPVLVCPACRYSEYAGVR